MAGIVIGIDVGGSTTKIVGIENGKIHSPLFIKADDPVTSLFGAFGKYVYDNGFSLSDIEHVRLTGVGSGFVNSPLYGLPTSKAGEFEADALGASYATGMDSIIVVSMGTGTSFVKYHDGEIRHLGGLGIGGGTLQGLSRIMLQSHDIHQVEEMALKGNPRNVNLLIGDVCNTDLPGLPLTATASLMGKLDTNSAPEDVAAGIAFMTLQTIGSAGVFCSMNTGIKDLVLIGNMTRMPQCKAVFEEMENLYDIRFHIPDHAEYCTAIGAALSYTLDKTGK